MSQEESQKPQILVWVRENQSKMTLSSLEGKIKKNVLSIRFYLNY